MGIENRDSKGAAFYRAPQEATRRIGRPPSAANPLSNKAQGRADSMRRVRRSPGVHSISTYGRSLTSMATQAWPRHLESGREACGLFRQRLAACFRREGSATKSKTPEPASSGSKSAANGPLRYDPIQPQGVLASHFHILTWPVDLELFEASQWIGRRSLQMSSWPDIVNVLIFGRDAHVGTIKP